MNGLSSFLKKALACASSALLLLTVGCDTNMRASRKAVGAAVSSELKIYCNSYYYHAFERVIRTIGSEYPDLKVTFTEVESSADILITDRMDDERAKGFAALDNIADIAEFIPELLYRSGGEIIGLPLFLETDGVWIDKLPYIRENAAAPCRFPQTFGSEFIRSNPMLTDDESLYWGFIAPLCISRGGSAEEIGSGRLSEELSAAGLERLKKMADSGILKKSRNPSDLFTSGKTAGWLCSYLDIIKIQQNMPLSSKLVFTPGINAYENENINLIIRADTLFVSEKANRKAAEFFMTELFGDDNILRLITDTHLPSAVKVNCKNHSLPEIFREFFSVLSSTAVNTVYVTDKRSDSAVSQLNSLIDGIFSP